MMRHLMFMLPLFLSIAPALAETSQEKGLAIIVKQDQNNKGFKDYTNSMVMTLKDAQGNSAIRTLRAGGLEVERDGDKSFMVFDTPADVKGTSILTHSHGIKNDDQWLFLPAVKRVKRLSSNNKSGPFMGSEFAYEDLSSPVVEKYTYNYLREEKCGALQCHVIERTPKYENSGYTRMVLWIDIKELRTFKVEYYDRKSSLLKTLNNSGYKLYLKKYWRAETGDMVNHQNGKGTILVSSNFLFGVGLKTSDFEPEALDHLP